MQAALISQRVVSFSLFVFLLTIAAGCSPTIKRKELSEALPEIVADEPGRVIGEPDDEIAFIYDQTQFRSFELRLRDEDLDFLDRNPAAEQYVTGTLVFEGVEYGPVGIRYKGSLGAWNGCTENSVANGLFDPGGAKVCPKLNLKVSFNEFNSDGRFFGVKKLLFHALNADDSLMRERLGYWVFRQMQVPAPRAVHVRLLINGEFAGVFLNVEYIDGRFTRSRFADGEGNLYKEIWPTSSYMQPSVTAGRLLEGLRTNEDENPSVDKMRKFGDGVMSVDGDESARAIASWMSVENTMRLIAVDRTIRADDGPFHFYCGDDVCDNHNFYIYEEQFADRVWLIPWDLDNSFSVIRERGLNADSFVNITTEWNDHSVDCVPHPGGAAGAPWQMPPACDPLIQGLGSFFGDFYDLSVNELLDGPFSPQVVEAQLVAWEEQIADAVAEAAATDSRQLEPLSWAAGMSEIRERIGHLQNQATANLR